jgi:hypothetical protein
MTDTTTTEPDVATPELDIGGELRDIADRLRAAWAAHDGDIGEPCDAHGVAILTARAQALAALADLRHREPGYIVTVPTRGDADEDRRLRERLRDALRSDPPASRTYRIGDLPAAGSPS